MKRMRLWPVGRADLLFFSCLGLGVFCLIVSLYYFRIWLASASVLPFGYCVFRVFSRNLHARKKEDEAFGKVCRFCKKKVKKAAEVLSYDSEELARTCPECGEKIYSEECQGVFYIVCPKCGARFLVDFS